MKVEQIKIIRPDDWHCHFRDENFLETTVPISAKIFARAIAMPNLTPPIIDVKSALSYHQRLVSNAPEKFVPLMTLYLTDETTPKMIKAAAETPEIVAAKLYPAGVTTHSTHGIRDIMALYPVFEAMQAHGLRLLIHGESAGPNIDIFDREKDFLVNALTSITEDFPSLNVVLEHITTQAAVDFVLNAGKNLAATITPHHLYYNRNALFDGGLRPHRFCLPLFKREADRRALLNAATSGNPKFFLGTDSAPHAIAQKESACGCAGIFNASTALSVYTSCFDAAGALDKLEGFTSQFGPRFYGLAENQDTLTLVKKPWRVPEKIRFAETQVVPFCAGQTLEWSIQNDR